MNRCVECWQNQHQKFVPIWKTIDLSDVKYALIWASDPTELLWLEVDKFLEDGRMVRGWLCDEQGNASQELLLMESRFIIHVVKHGEPFTEPEWQHNHGNTEIREGILRQEASDPALSEDSDWCEY